MKTKVDSLKKINIIEKSFHQINQKRTGEDPN
jgi:hypothetical protein